ncbi:methyl-accepting chemotaxis protein [Bosea sp. 124]|uniref:methyl-accepting chemotaxis protein n=1 Tax=Bosea sp. 124 TaxID=2135642 RepID=UPI000D3B0438|nr:methyl-accepting chemotaxis protein [Bosea sp. 124]PTM40407.1 methyl-accepting chemotaxis protein [Bosea sp. 124]
MRVTHFLICTIAAGGAAILASGYVAYTQMQALSTARETRSLVVASDAVSRVIERAAIERGAITQVVLAADPDGKIAAAATQAARDTDARIVQMQEGFAATTFARRPDLAGSVNQIGQRLAEARKLATAEGNKPLEQRDPKASQLFSASVLELLNQQSSLQRQIGARIGNLNPDVSNTVSLGELATTMREAAGSRSVHYTQFVGSGVKLTPIAVSQVDRSSGRIEQLWLLIDQALAQMQTTAQLKTALEAAKTGFRDEEARTYGAMHEAARDGKPAGISLADWRAWTQKSLATILQMRDAAFEQARAEIDADLSLAGWRLVLSLLAILVVTGVVVGVVLLFHRGVVRPLGQLANSVGLMLSGADDAKIPAKVNMVEIDAISHALGDFQANIQRVRALEEQERTAAAARLARAQSMEAVVSDVGEVVAAAAAGDFSARLQIDQADEQMQKLVAGINEINAVVDSATSEFARTLSAVAGGDLTVRVDAAYRGKFAELKGAINETVDRLSSTVRTIQVTSADVGLAAREINMGADDLSKRTEEQASSLEETAATTEELAASVKASAQASRDAAAIANDAMQAAQSGGAIAGQAVDAMARIETASQKISDIIRVIDDIAFQTNLLALNAAVEAARAGDAGKGFAVVASEVRTLAQRSSAAAKDISGLISSSNMEVGEGVKLVRQAGDQLSQILSHSQKVAATIADISAASGEQANGIDEMSQAVAHLDEMTQQNAALAEQSAASAGSLSGRIGQLNDLVAAFRTGPDEAPRARAPAPPAAAPAASEPERLRKLAEAAFVQPKAQPARVRSATPAPTPPARKVANSRASDAGWEEF